MHISPLEEYGLRCVLQLARGQGEQLSSSKIAELEGISSEYVSKIMHLLKKAELVKATRGVQGGFYLAYEPSRISLKDVFDSLDAKKTDESEKSFCNSYSGQSNQCVHTQDCSIKPVWHTLLTFFDDFLRQVSLQDLLEKEAADKSRVHADLKSRLELTLQKQLNTFREAR